MDAGQQLTLRRWTRFVLKWAIIIELAWLAIVNSLLFLPLTQDVINLIRPEKFYIQWERAWSPWPGRVYVRDVVTHGNSRSQMWELRAKRVSGSVSLLPLILKRVWARNVRGENVTYRQRPRPREDRDFSANEAWFPPIGDREVTPAVTGPYRSKRSWRTSIKDAVITGEHDYWIFDVRGTASGTVSGAFKAQSRGGPVEINVRHMELQAGPHSISGTHDLVQGGRLRGSLEFLKFLPRVNRGIDLLNFVRTDLEMEFDADDLSFINLFLLNFKNFQVKGAGQVEGRLVFDQGWVKPGTDLRVDADDLSANLLDMTVQGNGQVNLSMDAANQSEMQLGFSYDDLSVTHKDDGRPSLTGKSLDLVVGGDGRVLPDLENPNTSRSIGLSIDRLAVPDLALFQRYVPAKWPLTFHGGEGDLSGNMEIRPTAISTSLKLVSSNADIAMRDYRFDTDLEAAVELHNPDLTQNRTRVGGSYLKLRNSHLNREGSDNADAWASSLEIHSGKFGIFQKADRVEQEHILDLFSLLAESRTADLMGDSSGEFDFELFVSSLEWLSVFLDEQYGVRIEGSSRAKGFALLESGLPAPGTWLEWEPENLSVGILDYISRGEGKIRLDVEKGGAHPDWRLGVRLSNAELKNATVEGPAYVKDVDMSLDMLVEDVSFETDRQREFDIRFAIPSARVTDMTVFNRDLPPDSPFRFLSGEAELVADILLQADHADGGLTLVAPEVTGIIDDQEIDAALSANVKISGGQPGNRIFDLDGSEIVLDQVRVRGERADFEQQDWSARLLLTRGRATWITPVELDLVAELAVSDSRPFVALFSNQGWRPDFLTRAMTIENITGDALLQMTDRRIVIPHARIEGEKIETLAKAIIEGESRHGVIYARFGKLDALLRFKDGKRNLDVFNAREKFEQYEPER